ncbi:MAG: hypothetical protein ACPLKP_00050 [Microgenomates group bacterium]
MRKSKTSFQKEIEGIINLVNKVNKKRKITARRLAQKLGRIPTFIEVTEELRRIEGDKTVGLPQNIINTSLMDAYLALRRNDLNFAIEKIIIAARMLVLGIESEIISQKRIPSLAQLFSSILKIQWEKKIILPKEIDQLVLLCFEIRNFGEDKEKILEQIKIIKKILNTLSKKNSR